VNEGGNSKVKVYVWIGALVLLGIILVVDFNVHHHAHFAADGIEIDATPDFFEMYGFACGLLLVIVAKVLAVALKRKDTFYADD